MVSVTKYPTTISQTSGGNFRTFNNLENLKNSNNTYAKSSNRIQSKSGTYKRPSSITCKGFNFSLPVGSEITKITVEYAHQKIDYTKDKYPSIAAPTITLLGVGDMWFSEETGSAPTKTMTARSKSWNGKHYGTDGGGLIIADLSPSLVTDVQVSYTLPSYTQINSSNFGVKINYPSNTGAYEGWLQLKYIRITVTYKASSYSFKISSNTPVYVDTVVPVQIVLNNLQLTRYKPTVILSLPDNCTIQNSDGSLSENSDGTYTWNANISNQRSDILNLELIFDDDCETSLIVRETLNDAFAQFNYTVNPTPSGYVEEEASFGSTETVYAVNGTAFDFTITVPESILENSTNIKLYTDNNLYYSMNNGSSFSHVYASNAITIPSASFTDGEYTFKLRSPINGLTYLSLGVDNEAPTGASYLLKVTPAGLGYPSMNIIKLSEDDLTHLSPDVTYVVSSDLKVNVDTSKTSSFHDYYKNFRLGVYNGPDFDSNVVKNLCDNCKEWSSVMTVLNEEETKTVSFTYNEEYPVYIIITGEYTGGNPHDLQLEYSFPLLYEVNESGSEDCILPSLLESVIASDNIADVTIPNFKSSNPFVMSKFPFDEDFETGENMAIRGIQLNATLSATEKIGVSATLKSPNGEVGSNSFIFDSENEETISMGGMFDLWGFNISDMVDLGSWEVEMQLSNNFNNPNGSVEVSISNVSLTVYFMKVQEQLVKCYINGEDTRWYGMFLKLPEIPKGLKMNTKYINNEGTDVNAPIKQNIQASEIKLTFGVHGCSIFETSQLLNEISELIVNERDSKDRPIPNTIEFSHFPGEHWEYLCNDTFDNDVEAADYETTVTLDVPAGTSYSNNDSVSGANGVVKGVAKVNPIITITNISGETVELTENNTGQKFTINYPFDSTRLNTVEIDCIYRKVKLKLDDELKETDITSFVDFNSAWFVMHGRFDFTSMNCVIQSVIFNERR